MAEKMAPQTYENLGDKATRFGFGEGVVAVGQRCDSLVVLGADITASVGLADFKKVFAERFFSFGIAEQNIAAVAAGLALSGKVPVFSTYGVFATMRAADQIRISICYNNAKVIIGGAHAGLSVGPDGATHQALEDLAVMRALPNMTVISPCDSNQTRAAVEAAFEQVAGPVYIRYGREPVPNFTPLHARLSVGQAQVLRPGTEVTLVATGLMVWKALEAANSLANSGIQVEVINLHTIKPIDTQALVESARKTGAVVTAEEHQLNGGLGSAVAEVLAQHHPVPMEFVGMPNCFGESGSADELLKKYGMTSQNIVNKALRVIERKSDG